MVGSACGGKLLASSEPGADASSRDGAGGGSQGDDNGMSGGSGTGGGSGGNSSGVSSGGFSSSSGGSSTGGGSIGASSSGAGGVTCTSSATGRRGTVCCGTISMTTSCQVGPCPSSAIGPLQLCSSDSECFTPGDTCAPLPVAPTLPIKICSKPTPDAGSGCAALCGGGCCDSTGACLVGAGRHRMRPVRTGMYGLHGQGSRLQRQWRYGGGRRVTRRRAQRRARLTPSSALRRPSRTQRGSRR